MNWRGEDAFTEFVRETIDDFLNGPTIQDRKDMIEPDAGLRLLIEATCDHAGWNHVMCQCEGCGITRHELIEELRDSHPDLPLPPSFP